MAVEYVDGEPIDRYCSSRSLDVAAILKLFDQVCQAVQYAHRRLIVHCDLKPANILVTQGGLVKLLDFGIARLLEAQAANATLDARLTPAYASPEQIEGKPLTAASDVFALGLVLYELLTGSLPNERDTLQGLVRRLEDRELPPPSAAPNLTGERRRAMHGDLDRIVLHALARDPERRYPSVEQLLADLERYRSGFPISVRRQNAAYRGLKFVKRNAILVAALALAVTGLVAGAAVAFAKERVAKQQQAAAEHRFHELQSLAHSVIFDLHDTIRGVPGTIEARRLLVTTALRYLDALNAEHIQDDSLQMELASGYLRMAYVQGGTVSVNMGQTGESEKSYRTALRIFDDQWRRHPNDLNIGTLRFATAYNLALPLNDPAAGAKMAAPYTDEVDAWVRRDPRVAPIQAQGLLHRAMGRTLRATGDLDGALREMSRSVEVLRAGTPLASLDESTRPMFATDVTHGQMLHDTGLSIYSLSGILMDMGRAADALAAALESERLFDLDAASSPPSPAVLRMLAVNHGLKADALLAMGRIAEAEAEVRESLRRVKRNVSSDQASVNDRRDLVEALRLQARILAARGDLNGCLSSLQDAAGIIATLAHDDPVLVLNRLIQAETLNDWGEALERGNHASAAKELFTQSLGIVTEAQREAPGLAELIRQSARGYAGLGRLLHDEVMSRRSAVEWQEFRRHSPLDQRPSGLSQPQNVK